MTTKVAGVMLRGRITSDGAANHNITADDEYVRMTRATANTVTVQPDADLDLDIGTVVTGIQSGAGQTTLTPGAGVTINGTPGLKTRTQYSPWAVMKVAANTWDAFGDLSA